MFAFQAPALALAAPLGLAFQTSVASSALALVAFLAFIVSSPAPVALVAYFSLLVLHLQ